MLSVWARTLVFFAIAQTAALELRIADAVAANSGPAGYHLLRVVALPDVTGWDYLGIHPEGRSLFISNNAGVIVINIDTMERIGTVPKPPDLRGVGLVHGVAIANDLGRGFMSREIPPSLLIFDLKSLAVLGTTSTDAGTDAVVYDPVTQRIFSLNGKHAGVHDATAVEAATGTALGNISLPGVPEFAVADGAGHLFVNIASRSKLTRIDTRALKVTATWSLTPCHEPGGLAIDVTHRRLFASCDNRILVLIDSDTGKVLSSVPTGEGTDAVTFDPGTGDVFASSGDGTMTIAHEASPDQLALIAHVKTAPEARTMALDPLTHRVFLVTAQFGDPPPRRTRDNPHGYPLAKPGTANLLVLGP